MTILETKGLTKKYRRITALNHLNLTIKAGMVFGLLGPNGSGKTTTLGLLLDVLKPTSGSYEWFGKPPSPEVRKKIGAILEHPCFYNYMSGSQNLKVVATIKECAESNIDRTLEIVGLSERRDDPYQSYSLGMKQRLAIASALLSDPNVLILDEPTNGLDPQGIVEIRELIQKIAATGKTIILASHLLDEVQKVCSDFMVLKKGVKIYQGSVNEALDSQKKIEVRSNDITQLKVALESFPGILNIEQESHQLIITPNEETDTERLHHYLIDQGIVLTHLVEKFGSLEQEFLKILASHD